LFERRRAEPVQRERDALTILRGVLERCASSSGRVTNVISSPGESCFEMSLPHCHKIVLGRAAGLLYGQPATL
jgi:hypothetical protein